MLLAKKFLRYKVDGSYGYGYSCSKYKVVYQFINNKLDKESWHCSINSGSNMI